ncbi:MAG TPA: HEAT repeat domain-containing protein [Planctomycetaceae bacterium]|nr:HEAT repeat domain-containing protein [Planctomycetaceae bacterium]
MIRESQPNDGPVESAAIASPATSEAPRCPLPGSPVIRLFVFPAVTVAAVIAVWLLFGAIASERPDWRTLVSQLRRGSDRERWVAAMELAHLLSSRGGRQGDNRLAKNRSLAVALASLLEEPCQTSIGSDEQVKHQAFLARALSLLDVPDVVLPPLQRAATDSPHRDVRKNALASIALIMGRPHPQTPPLGSRTLVEDLVRVSHEADPLLRQLSAYALGLCPGPAAQGRLVELLDDPDPNTRLNAAIGLARQGRTEGLPVFRRELEKAASSHSPTRREQDLSSADRLERLVRLRNTLKAVSVIAPRLGASTRRELTTVVHQIAETSPEPPIRAAALAALRTLRTVKPGSRESACRLPTPRGSTG